MPHLPSVLTRSALAPKAMPRGAGVEERIGWKRLGGLLAEAAVGYADGAS